MPLKKHGPVYSTYRTVHSFRTYTPQNKNPERLQRLQCHYVFNPGKTSSSIETSRLIFLFCSSGLALIRRQDDQIVFEMWHDSTIVCHLAPLVFMIVFAATIKDDQKHFLCRPSTALSLLLFWTFSEKQNWKNGNFSLGEQPEHGI